MVEYNREDFVMISDVVDFGTPEYKLMVRKAKMAGAYAKFGDEDHVAKGLVLARQVGKRPKRRSNRLKTKAKLYKSVYYRKVTTVKRMNRIISTIESGISSRQGRIDEYVSHLNSASDPIAISDNLRLLRIDRNDQTDAKSRLKAASERRSELESEENMILNSLREVGLIKKEKPQNRKKK